MSRLRETFPAQEEAHFASLVEERAGRRPIQHMIGEQEFWHRSFLVTSDVLIPRPETEGLIEASLEVLSGRKAPVVVDVGTGTGCIALSLAADLATARVHAVDVSAAALAVARENARRLGLEGRVTFHRGDLLEPVAPLRGMIDLIVSNPPYVDPQEAAGLAPEVRDHEPALALFPPGNRLTVYRRLVPEAAAALAPGGVLVLEIGQGMAPEVSALAGECGFAVERVLPDLQGIARTVVARRGPAR